MRHLSNAIKLHRNAVRINIHLRKKNYLSLNIWFSPFLGQEYKAPLTALIKSTNGTSIEEFLTAAENALQSCSMILKKIDKKKDRYAKS